MVRSAHIPEKGLDGQAGNAEPLLQIPSAQEEIRLAKLKQEITAREAHMPETELQVLQSQWEKTRLASLPLPPRESLVAHYEFDGQLVDTSGLHQHAQTVRGNVTFGLGPVGKAAEFNGETHLSLGNTGRFDWTDPFALAFWLNKAGNKALSLIQKLDATNGRRGYELAFDDSISVGDQRRGAHLLINLSHRWPEDSIQLRTKERIRMGIVQHVVLNYDGSGKAAGLKLFPDGQSYELEVIQDRLGGSINSDAPLENRQPGAGQRVPGLT